MSVDRTPPVAPALRVARTDSPFARKLREDLEQRLEAFASAAQRARRRADDEAIHDVRVSSRRLLAAIGLWRDLLGDRARGARRRLRRLRRRLGPLRETEVHAELLAGAAKNAPALTRLAVEGEGARLERRIRRARQAAARRLTRGFVRRVAWDLERGAGDLGIVLNEHPAAPAQARARLEQRRSDSERALARALETGDDQLLHAARIAVKKWRYAGEAAGPHLGSDAPLEPLHRLQQALGEVQDRATLRGWLERRIRRLRESGLEAHAEALAPLLESVESDRKRWVEQTRRLAEELALGRTRELAREG